MSAPDRRTAARVAAVQALFQLEFAAEPAAAVVEEFVLHRLAESSADRGLFDAIVRGVAERREDIDAALRPCLPERWPLERLDPVLRCGLRAGVFELLARADVPARVAIDEYVTVIGGFGEGPEAGIANSVLDRIARRVRPAEFARDGARAAPG